MATVTQYEPECGWYKSDQVSRATVEFVDQQSQGWSVEIENVPEARVGQVVRVVYDPKNPWWSGTPTSRAGIDFLFAAVMLVIATTLLSGALIGRPSSPRRRPVYLLLGVLGVAVWFLATLLFG
jgi:hypothetical protein